MTQAEAFVVAQQRADRLGRRIAVYQMPWAEPRSLAQEFYTTPDRPDFPGEWVVVGFADPKGGAHV